MALLNQYEIEKYIAATARRADLRVNWCSDQQVSTDGRVINLPRITDRTTPEEAEDMIGFVAHEVTHILHSDFKKFTDVGLDPNGSFLGAIANVLEDDGIDAINAAEFHGDRMIRNESHHRALTGIEGAFEQAMEMHGGTLPKELQAMASMIAWDSENRGDYYSNAPLHTENFEKFLGTEGKEYLRKLRAGNYYPRLKKLRQDESRERSAKSYEIARDIFREVYDLDPDEEEKKCKERMKQKEAEAAKGKGKEEQAGMRKGSSGGSKMGKGDKTREEWAEVDYTPFIEDQHDEFREGEMVMKGMRIDYSKYKEAGGVNYTPTSLANTIVVDYTKGTSNYSRITPTSNGGRERAYEEMVKRAGGHGEGFANKVRMLLQIRSKGRTQYGVKKGNLHQGNIYRVVIKDAPGYNERVFKKRIISDVLDTAVIIVADISGSMGGDKHAHQIVAVRQMNNAIGNAIRIPLMCVGFTELECRNAMFVWRRFDDQIVSAEKLEQRMMHSARWMNQNCDGDSILWAYHQLKQRKEKRKVMIVTSDGSPASSKGGDVYGFTKNVVKKIEADKSVDIYAIGIMDNNVKRIYRQSAVINRADEIETALLSIVEKKII